MQSYQAQEWEEKYHQAHEWEEKYHQLHERYTLASTEFHKLKAISSERKQALSVLKQVWEVWEV